MCDLRIRIDLTEAMDTTIATYTYPYLPKW